MKFLKIILLSVNAVLIASCTNNEAKNNEYKVTFTDSFDFAHFEGQGEYKSGDSVTIKASLDKGYEFESWTINGDTVTINPYTFEIYSNTNISLNYDYTTYFAFLDCNGGSLAGNIDKISFNITSDTINLPTPTKLNNSFLGWKEKNGSNFINTINKGTTQNYNLIAQWQPLESKDIFVTLVCDNKMGNVDGGGIYTSGHSFSVNAYPNKGYEFVGWYLNNSLISTEEVSYFEFESDVTLEARFKAITYSITYNLNKGVLPSNSVNTFTIETPTFLLPIPSRDEDDNYNYEFMYWKDNKSNVITEIKQGTTGNIELTAYWKENEKETKYKMVSSSSSPAFDYSKGIVFEKTIEPTIFRLNITVKSGDQVAFTDGIDFISNFNKTGLFNAFENDCCTNSSYIVTFTKAGDYLVELNIFSTPIIDIIEG